ncbi:hypothetical protein NV379_25410 [Paenibacillus sp. N1-5-1-14]|uniref:Ger(x)C family spore germination C-terminal domain-containing protein n=1 Tax=Paenibacillus radicibacter TaxID=2972488 RepID=UPI0021599148|nr:Ger(x)C family spore germination C-terminal domain-containing protein [Paenibacillus radicibacter]MCR8645964.1 hypothetical protein [Paenibacillus radicibacter]
MDDKAFDLIESNDPSKNEEIYQLIEKIEEWQPISLSSTFHFIRNNLDKMIDPTAPIIHKHEKQGLQISGIALFRNDKFVGELSEDDAKLLIMLMNRKNKEDLAISTNKYHLENPLLWKITYTSGALWL